MNSLKFILRVVMLCCLSTGIEAQSYSENQPAYQHLKEVNKEWKHYKDFSLQKELKFNSEAERIQFHLESVIAYLQNNTPNNLEPTSAQNRKSLLDTLTSYAQEKVFPKNIYHPDRQPYFIDHRGVHCAVGYLMKASGAQDLAQTISKEHNYDYVADIKTRGVTQWAEQNGFLLNELAWIQPGYPASTPFETIGKGTNGTIQQIEIKNQFSQEFIFAGDFDLVDSLPCLNIGKYENRQLSCIGTGIDGIINDIHINSTGEIIVVGALVDGGNTYPMATYNAGAWTYTSIPNKVNAIGQLIAGASYYYYDQELVISDSASIEQELWRLTSGQWEKVLSVKGEIEDSKTYSNMGASTLSRMYVGNFDSVTLHRAGLSDTTFLSTNVILGQSTGLTVPPTWHSVQSTHISDTIYTIAENNGMVYLGGTCSDSGEVCVSRYMNGAFQPLVENNGPYGSIHNSKGMTSLAVDAANGRLLIAGEFRYTPMMMGYWGNNLMSYDLVSNYTGIFNEFNAPVTTVAVLGTELFIGGAFTELKNTSSFGGTSAPMLHLAKLSTNTAIPKIQREHAFRAYPNPTTGDLTIDLKKEYTDVSVRVTNTLGQQVLVQKYTNTNSIQFNVL
ncbi:MAG: T9SS type A sorting domain-containing protein [Aureispira sp.]|nr:T9SS type A sorting domain-containing protein [Aureispira sp.]